MVKSVIMTKIGKRDQAANCHQWQGGRNCSKLTTINQLNVLGLVLLLHSGMEAFFGPLCVLFDSFMGQCGKNSLSALKPRAQLALSQSSPYSVEFLKPRAQKHVSTYL